MQAFGRGSASAKFGTSTKLSLFVVNIRSSALGVGFGVVRTAAKGPTNGALGLGKFMHWSLFLERWVSGA